MHDTTDTRPVLHPDTLLRIERAAQRLGATADGRYAELVTRLHALGLDVGVGARAVGGWLGLSRSGARDLLEVLRRLRVVRTEMASGGRRLYVLNTEDLEVIF